MAARRLEIAGIPALIAGPEEPRGVALFFHGAGGSKEKSLPHALLLHQAGILTLHPDAPHHGERGAKDVFKEKRLIAEATLGMAEEAGALVRYLKEAYPEKPLFLVGASMGGAVVYELLARGEKASAAAVWMSAGSPPPWLLPYMPPGYRPPLEKKAAFGEVPLLHLHGERDLMVPISLAERTIEELKERFAPGRLAFVRLAGLGHTPTPEMAALSAGWFWRWL